jgi:phosphate starvation-inducible PhoH-like protein
MADTPAKNPRSTPLDRAGRQPDDRPAEQSMVTLLGNRDEVLRTVERVLTSDVHVRGNEITLTGKASDNALGVLLFEQLLELLAKGETLTADSVERSASMLKQADGSKPADVLTLNILSNRGRTIRPKTLNQKRYVEAIDQHTIVFGIGPAGTGKTYLAMAKAVQALQAKQVNRIILTRPAVEAGERLGFLPGTLFDKIDPYLRPLYDALHDMLDPDSIPRLIAAGTIEVAPLAYMRGRAQPVDTQVLTPTGFAAIGSLSVGDLVVGSDGRPTPVLGVYPQGRKAVFRLTAQDGASTLACAEHLWAVTTPADRRRGKPARIVETREMQGRLRSTHAHRFELPVAAPVELEPRDVPMDPYALGLLLGDGCLTTSTTPSFTTRDPELAEALGAALPDIDPGPQELRRLRAPQRHRRRGGVLVANPVTVVLRDLGLAGTRSSTKFVPVTTCHNSVQVRLALLQGLLDSDGGPVRQRGRTCRVQYTTCSDRLRDDVVSWCVPRRVAYVRTRRRRAAARLAQAADVHTARRPRPRHRSRGHRAVPAARKRRGTTRPAAAARCARRQHRAGGRGGVRLHPGRRATRCT